MVTPSGTAYSTGETYPKAGKGQFTYPKRYGCQLLTPSGTGARALAVIARPTAILTDAVGALAFDLAARWIQNAVVLALTRGLEHAVAVLVAHVVVLTFAA